MNIDETFFKLRLNAELENIENKNKLIEIIFRCLKESINRGRYAKRRKRIVTH